MLGCVASGADAGTSVVPVLNEHIRSGLKELSQNAYKALEIDPGADTHEIKRAFRRVSLRCAGAHADLVP